MLDQTPAALPQGPDAPLLHACHLQRQETATGLVAIVDDDESIRDSLKTLLRSAGYRAAAFPSAELFLESGIAVATGCLILDVRMPGMGGPELQDRLNASHSPVPIVFMSAHYDSSLRLRLMEAGAVDLLRKPFAADDLLQALNRALNGISTPLAIVHPADTA